MFLYKLPIWVTVFCVLFCSVLSINIQPSFASELPSLPFSDIQEGIFQSIDFTCTYTEGFSGFFAVGNGVYSFEFNSSDVIPYHDPITNYIFEAVEIRRLSDDAILKPTDIASPYVLDTSEWPLVTHEGISAAAVIYVNSVGVPPTVAEVLENPPLYYSVFEMFSNFIYGEGAELTAEQNMTLTILATLAALFVVLFPFLIIFLVVRFIIWLR